MKSLQFQSARALAAAIREGEVSPVEVVEAYLNRIADRNDELNAYVTVLEADARERAREAAQAVERGANLGPLHGVPIAIKDQHQPKEGVPATEGFKPLADNVASETALVVERLEAAGAIVLGTTNTPEAGHTMRTDNELVGPTPTPFDPDGEHNAAGSSGGSAAALADGLAALATGCDTGGSIRNPASACGVVSVKPTLGLIPEDLRPDAFTANMPISVVGPMARTVEDVALMLSVLVGKDDVDPYSVPAPDVDYVAATNRPATEYTIAYTPDLDTFPVAPEVRAVCRDAVDAVGAIGVESTDVTVRGPSKAELKHAYGTSAATQLATEVRYLEDEYSLDITGADAEDVSSSLVNTVTMGKGHDVEAYLDTNKVRTELYDAIQAVLDEYDTLVLPTLATPPLTHDEPYPTEIDGEPAGGLMLDWGLTWPFNLTGHPVVSVPAGLSDDGLPIGLQLVGSRYAEDELLAIAAAFEQANPWTDDYRGISQQS